MSRVGNRPVSLPDKTEVVFLALHGTYGEDGAVQGFLQCMQIPCTGSDILASAMAMDKVMSKRIFDNLNLPTPKWTTVTSVEECQAAAEGLGMPIVIFDASNR